MSDLKTSYLLLLLFSCSISAIQLWGRCTLGWDNEWVNELERANAGVTALVSLTAFALGEVLWSCIFAAMAVLSYYRYRKRGGGRKEYDEKSILGKYAPW